MPRILSDTDVSDFRERLCEAAEKLFAERGPDAVTMRQLAAELGVSPMTPYRYFEDKNEILAAVRTNGFNRFAEALEAARDKASTPRAKGAAVGEAYMTFALEHPHTYKLMFDLNQPDEQNYPELVKAGQRARATMSGYVKDQVSAGLMVGDAEEIGERLEVWGEREDETDIEIAVGPAVQALADAGRKGIVDLRVTQRALRAEQPWRRHLRRLRQGPGPHDGLLRREHRHRDVELRAAFRDERQLLQHESRSVDRRRRQPDLRPDQWRGRLCRQQRHQPNQHHQQHPCRWRTLF